MSFTHEPETVFSGSFYKKGTGSVSKFITLNITPSFNQNRNSVNVSGATLPVAATQGIPTSEWSGEGVLCWEELMFLSGCNPSANTATSFKGGIISHTPSDPNLFNLYHRDIKAENCCVSAFSINGNTEQITTNVTFIGGGVVTGQTAQTVTAIAPTLFEAHKTTISIDDTELDRVNAWSVEFSDIWAGVNYLGEDNTPNQTVAQTSVSGSFSATLPYDLSATLGSLSDNGEHTCEITNSTVVGTSTYTFTISFKFRFDNTDSPQDTDNVWTLPIKGIIVNDTNDDGYAVELIGTKTTTGA